MQHCDRSRRDLCWQRALSRLTARILVSALASYIFVVIACSLPLFLFFNSLSRALLDAHNFSPSFEPFDRDRSRENRTQETRDESFTSEIRALSTRLSQSIKLFVRLEPSEFRGICTLKPFLATCIVSCPV